MVGTAFYKIKTQTRETMIAPKFETEEPCERTVAAIGVSICEAENGAVDDMTKVGRTVVKRDEDPRDRFWLSVDDAVIVDEVVWRREDGSKCGDSSKLRP